MAEGDRVAGTGQEILRDPEKEKKDNKEAAFGKKMRSEGCFFYYYILYSFGVCGRPRRPGQHSRTES